LVVTLLEDHRQKRLFPTTIGGGATVKSSDKWRVTSDEQFSPYNTIEQVLT
jgi:hypothetical protein